MVPHDLSMDDFLNDKSGPIPSTLKGLSQERPVPRVGLSQEWACKADRANAMQRLSQSMQPGLQQAAARLGVNLWVPMTKLAIRLLDKWRFERGRCARCSSRIRGPKSAPVPRMGLSQERACPKSGPVPRVGLSQEWACPKNGPVPRVGLSQGWACPKSGPVPRVGLSQGHVPRVGLFQDARAILASRLE